MAGLLQAAKGAHLEQVAHVQAVGRRVESRVPGHPPAVEAGPELRIGHLVDQPPEAEVFDEGGHGHSLPCRRDAAGRYDPRCRHDCRGRRGEDEDPW